MADSNSTPKTCNVCKKTKPVNDFAAKANGHPGLAGACNACQDRKAAKLASRTPEQIAHDAAKKERRAEYKQANKDKFNAYRNEYVKQRRATDPEYVAHIYAKKVRSEMRNLKHDAHVRTRNNWIAKHERKALAAPARAAKAEAKAAQAAKAAFARAQKDEARAFFASVGAKVCSSCGLLHLFGSYHKHTSAPDGLMAKCKKCDCARIREERRANPLVRLRKNIRNSIRSAIVNAGYSKRSRTEAILGCTFDEFKTHIERQFTKGMRWELIGARIHVDHVVPLASAKTEEEIISLNHVSNLRPLWAEDNLAKSAKRLHLL